MLSSAIATGDARPVLDDVHEGHGVPTAEVVVVGQPGDDLPALGVGPVAPRVRLVDELLRGLAGLLLDGVEVGLEGHGGPLSWRGRQTQ
jgi:hypothetical protein